MLGEFPASLSEGLPLGQKLANELRLRIISGKIAAGSILSENQIAAEYEVSRAPVRDALKTLSNEGLIRLERMGIVVLGLNGEDMKELYDVRFLIEGFVLDRLTLSFDESVKNALNQMIDKMQLAEKYNDEVEFARCDMEFHEIIIHSAKHKRIYRLWDNIRHIIFAALLVATKKRFANEFENGVPELIEQHRKIVEALELGDPEHTKKVARNHYIEMFETVSLSLRSGRTEET